MQISFEKQAVAGLLGVLVLFALLSLGVQAGLGDQTQDPVQGDTYVEAMVGEPHWVNPLLALSDTDRDLSYLVFSGLLRVDDTGNLAPDLASEWTSSPDSRVFTFTLRPNLRWHDGQPLTAGDVVFTYKLLQASDFGGDPALAVPWKSVEITQRGDSVVVLTLRGGDASFPQYTTLGILPRHIWESVKPADLAKSPWNTSPIGSGRWRYANLATPPDATGAGAVITDGLRGGASSADLPPAEGVLLVRTEQDPLPTAGPARIWFRLYPSFGAALTGFKLGEVHGLGHIPQESMAEVAAVPGAELHTRNLARYNMLILNLDSPLFDKVETRRAFELALDRQALAARVPGTTPLHSPILPHSWAYSEACAPERRPDKDYARTMLEAAGWRLGPSGVRVRDGVTMTVVVAANSDLPLNVEMARGVVDSLRAVGVDARLAAVGRDVLLRDYLGPRAFHVVLAGWEASGADLDLYRYWHSSQAATGGLNFAGWRNPQADKALEEARGTAQRNVRFSGYCNFQKAFAADVPAIVLGGPLYTYATRRPAAGVSLPDTDLLGPASRFSTLDRWRLQAP